MVGWLSTRLSSIRESEKLYVDVHLLHSLSLSYFSCLVVYLSIFLSRTCSYSFLLSGVFTRVRHEGQWERRELIRSVAEAATATLRYPEPTAGKMSIISSGIRTERDPRVVTMKNFQKIQFYISLTLFVWKWKFCNEKVQQLNIYKSLYKVSRNFLFFLKWVSWIFFRIYIFFTDAFKFK